MARAVNRVWAALMMVESFERRLLLHAQEFVDGVVFTVLRLRLGGEGRRD